MTWRVGQHYGIHVYEGDRPVATFHTAEDAQRAVEAYNDTIPPPPPCGEEHLRPGGVPRDNWDWLKCMHDQGHEGDHEDDESGFQWPQTPTSDS